MKKILSLLLSLLLVFSVTACNNTASDRLSNESGGLTDEMTNISADVSSEGHSSTQDTNSSSSDNQTANNSTTKKPTANKPAESSKPIAHTPSEGTPPATSEATESNQTQTQPEKSEEKIILPPIIDTQQEKYRPNYMLGNCRSLKDNPLVVLLFIDDDESSWSAKEVTEFTDNYINEGLSYIEDKAREWGVNLNFSVKSYSTPLSEYTLKYEGSVIKDLRINGSSKDVLDQAAYDMGYSSNWELYSKFKTEHGNDNDVIFLTFINKPGKSYTRHLISTGQSSYSEHCVIFSDYLEGASFGCMASTVAHELLHLFGAEDYYSGYREFLAYQVYPKDIMLWMPTEAYENEIGDFTAYTIGWTDTVPKICHNEYWRK